MIRINLLKNASEKRRPRGRIARKIAVFAAVAICVVALSGGGLWGYRTWVTARKATVKAEDKRVVRQDLAPSSYTGANMVEEVVKEVNDSRLKLRESGILDLPYEQLSFSEKVNYELLFTKTVCEMLSRIIPGGIGLKSLEIDNFQTVYAVGLGSSREIIERMLGALKQEKVTVLPPPYSFIKPAGKDGLRFAFSCKTQFGLNLIDPLVDGALTRLPSRAVEPDVIEEFEKIAKKSRVKLTGKPTHVSTEKFGNYYRSIYQWTGVSSYKDFVAFVLSVYDAKLMGAFKRCALAAQTAAAVKIESQIVITTKE
ncbi:MAG TPA: hypothetical protein VF335_06110 [Chitinivibrionales bacterium]